LTDKQMEEMAANIKDAIRQLESLQEHCESMIDKKDPDPESSWEADVKALKYGIAALKILSR